MKDGASTRALSYLCTHHVATLATHGGNGPWGAAVFYANDGFKLFFLSSPASRHCLNLQENSRIAVTIQEDYSDWPEIKGIQLEGVARELSGDEEIQARQFYGQKFPLVANLAQAPAAIVKAMAKVRWYRIDPRQLYFIDNSAGFGQRAEIDLTQAVC